MSLTAIRTAISKRDRAARALLSEVRKPEFGRTGRPRLNIPVKNIYAALCTSRTLTAAAHIAGCSRGYIRERVPNCKELLGADLQ